MQLTNNYKDYKVGYTNLEKLQNGIEKVQNPRYKILNHSSSHKYQF